MTGTAEGQAGMPVLHFLIAAGDGSAGLRRIPVAMIARGFKGKQKFTVTAADLASIVKNFRARGTGEVVIDYDHSTEFAAGTGDAVPAAGWLKKIDDGPDGSGVLWGEAEFTERAAKMLAAREYKYFSPVLVWGARSKESGEPQGTTLTSIALTNSPLLEKLPAFVMSDGFEIDRGDAEDVVRKEKRVVKIIMADRVARTVRAVNDDNTESTVVVEGLEAPAKVVRMSDVARDSEGRFNFAALNADGETLIAGEVFRGMQMQSEMDAAVKGGLITPAQRKFYEPMALADIGEFRKLLATMKPSVDTTERGIGGGDALAASDLQKVEAQIDRLTREKMASGSTASGGKLQYHEAMKLVASEHPDLDKRRTALQRAKASGGEQ